MMMSKIWKKLPGWTRAALPGLATLALVACAGTPAAPPEPQTDSSGETILAAGDIAIAGQLASHSIMDLPEVANATVPPLVRFVGVTSSAGAAIDTAPYTELLRDRMLLITREKLRFVERTLPPLHAHKGKHAKDVSSDLGHADDEVTAVLGGNPGGGNYLVRIQFIDLSSGQPLFTGVYRIRPEANAEPSGGTSIPGGDNGPLESTAPSAPTGGPAPYPPGQGSSTIQ
jgi:hypothetical protein